MRVTSKVSSDQKEIANLIRRLKVLEDFQAEYGYFADQIHEGSGMNMADLAAMQNDGTKNIPPRPFMDETNKAMSRWFEVNKTWKIELWDYLKWGKGIKPFYTKIANESANAIRTVIDTGDWADNVAWWEQAKIEKYGTTAPLIETQELYEGAIGRVTKVNEK